MTDKALNKFASIVAETDARTPVAWLGTTLDKATVWLTKGGSICLRSGDQVLALTAESLSALGKVLDILAKPGRIAALESAIEADMGLDADYSVGVRAAKQDSAMRVLTASGMEYLSDGLWGWVDSTAVAHVDGGLVEFKGDYTYTPAQLRALADLAEQVTP